MADQDFNQLDDVYLNDQMSSGLNEFEFSTFVDQAVDAVNAIATADIANPVSPSVDLVTDHDMSTQFQVDDLFMNPEFKNLFENPITPVTSGSEKTTPAESPDLSYVSAAVSVSGSPKIQDSTNLIKTQDSGNFGYDFGNIGMDQQFQHSIIPVDNGSGNNTGLSTLFGSLEPMVISADVQVDGSEDYSQTLQMPNELEILNFPSEEEIIAILISSQSQAMATGVESTESQSMAVPYVSETVSETQPMDSAFSVQHSIASEFVVPDVPVQTLSEQDISPTSSETTLISNVITGAAAKQSLQTEVNLSFSPLTKGFVPSCNVDDLGYHYDFSCFTTFSNFERELKRSIRNPNESVKELESKLKSFVAEKLLFFKYHPCYLVLDSPAHKYLCDEVNALAGTSHPRDSFCLQDKLKDRVAKSKTYKAKLEWGFKWVFYLNRLNAICYNDIQQGRFCQSYVTAYRTINQVFVEVDKDIIIKTKEMEEVTRSFEYLMKMQKMM